MDKALALVWHLIDAGLHISRPHKKARMLWAGVGVGWAMYWIIKYYTERRYVTTRSDYDKE